VEPQSRNTWAFQVLPLSSSVVNSNIMKPIEFISASYLSMTLSIALLGLGHATMADKVLRMDIQRPERSIMDSRRLRPRNTVLALLANNQRQGGYFAKVAIGNPSQSLSLQLDTGSSDVWVPSSSATSCQRDSNQCSGGTCEHMVKSTRYMQVADLSRQSTKRNHHRSKA